MSASIDPTPPPSGPAGKTDPETGPETSPGAGGAHDALSFGAIALVVRDLATVSGFYRDVVGLAPIAVEAGRHRLGIDGRTLVELRSDPDAVSLDRRAAGLFHTAFLLPERADLADWLRHASATGVRLQGASDHLVSEAVYLADPEGNSVEIYADRPAADWPRRGPFIAMATNPFDVPGLLACGRAAPWRGAPAGTRIGHVHLQVGALAEAERFYAGVLGLPITARYPGAIFYGSGGYHHHIATNIWNSRGAPARDAAMAGLAEMTLHLDAAALDTVAQHAAAAGIAVEPQEAGLRLRDPWGTLLTLADPER